MSTQKIRWIIGLMSFALLGLIYFQFYWIDSVLKANEERFKNDVREVLRIVTLKLEKQEVLDATFDNLKTTFQWQRSNNGKEIELIESTFEKRILDIKDIDQVAEINSLGKLDHQNISFIISNGPDGSVPHADPNKTVAVVDRAGDEGTPKVYFKKRIDSIDLVSMKLEKELQKVVNKSEMVQVVIHELLTNNRTIEKRINKAELDSLLHMELNRKGIELHYDYAVVDPAESGLVLSSLKKPEPPPSLLNTDLKASLFPNDILGESSLLLISFPEQQEYLFRKIWLTLSSSVFLIFVIIFCFGYAIHTILKQKKLSEIKNDFINNMTHEFKTPISTVALACEALQDSEVNASPGLTERYVGIINDENKRLGQQVEKVLQMAVIERKDFKLKPEPLEVHGIIDKAIENIKIQVEKRGGSIQFEGKALHTELYADEMHLTNIIYNLLDNANKYSGEAPQINVATHDNSEGIIITVSDQGIGMTKDQQSRIFERFYRVPTGDIHDVKGFGLGLAYVRRIVNAHGGDVTVKSRLNEGSTFEIFIPFEHQYEGD